MSQPPDAKVEAAKLLLSTVRNGAMATVNADGSPHNTPFHYLIDEACEYLYWASSPQTQHSENVERSGDLFVVIYDPQGHGLYLQAEGAHELADEELTVGLAVWNTRRAHEQKQPLPAALFDTQSPQRMYRAYITKFWVNESEKDSAGHIIRDFRRPIDREDLLLTR